MKKSIISLSLILGIASAVFAGNPDRSGSAGASHLLVNPWARSSGLGNASLSSVTGVESVFFNVSGLAFTKII